MIIDGDKDKKIAYLEGTNRYLEGTNRIRDKALKILYKRQLQLNQKGKLTE